MANVTKLGRELFSNILCLTLFSIFREVDFVNDVVRTLAGNGTKGSDYRGGGKGTNQACLGFSLFLNVHIICVCY